MALNLGGIIRLTYAVRNDVGALVNPTTATLAITQPDGTVAAGTTVTLPPAVTGQLVVDFTPAQSGLHSVRWATTVPSTAEDDVFVAERPASMLVSVDEAVNHLRAAGIITSDADRETLQWLCMVATDAVERDLGRTIVRRTVVEECDGGDSYVQLSSTPVISITSVVDAGLTLSAGDYRIGTGEVGKLTGLLYRSTSTYRSSFARGYGSVVVTYATGYTDPPRVVRQVALGLVQGNWQASQQAFHPALEADELAGQVASIVSGMLPIEQQAFESLRAVGVA